MTDEVRPLLRSRNYLLWLAGDTAQQLGLGLGSFAMPLLTLIVTGSATSAGTVGALQAVGMVIGFLPGGVLADRYDRRVLRAWSAIIGLVLSAVLAALAALGWLDIWALANIGFLLQLRASVLTPASEAMLRGVVAKPHLAQAVANNQGRDAAVTLASGPIGGVLFAVGHAVPFVAQALSFVVMWASNRAIRGEFRAERTQRTSPLQDLRDGLSFVGRSPLIMWTCAAFMLLNLAMNGVVITTIYSLQLAGHRPEVIGLVLFALGVGAIIGSVAAGSLAKRVPTGALILACMVFFTAAMATVTVWPSITVILVAVGAAMLAAPAVNAAIGGLLLHIVPDDILGRVQSVISFIAILMAPLAPALGGWGLGLMGAQATFGFFTTLGLIGTLIAALRRDIRGLPRMDRWDEVIVHPGTEVRRVEFR